MYHTHAQPIASPGITGALIPSLMNWGEHALAREFVDWLLSIQNTDGSWSDMHGLAPQAADTSQVLEGLWAMLPRRPDLEGRIRRGCDWLVTQVQSSGRAGLPDTRDGSRPGAIPEAIHLSALPVLKRAADRWNERAYQDLVDRVLRHRFTPASLGELHSRVVEALCDLGAEESAATLMRSIARRQAPNGAVATLPRGSWVCSPALFQYAIAWYRLGERRRADLAFAFACGLQNESGGFFGGYGPGADYFPAEEVGWAVKYFLDAFWWKLKTGFDPTDVQFPESISAKDGRYRLIDELAQAARPRHVMDMGCGRGRFLRRLQGVLPSAELTGLDLSDGMLKVLPSGVAPLSGSLLNIPCPDACVDFAFCVEALEHAVNVPAALREMSRVVASGGTLVVIDKNRARLGDLTIAEWEQWFDEEELTRILEEVGFQVTVRRNVAYERKDGADGLFLAWIARKR